MHGMGSFPPTKFFFPWVLSHRVLAKRLPWADFLTQQTWAFHNRLGFGGVSALSPSEKENMIFLRFNTLGCSLISTHFWFCEIESVLVVEKGEDSPFCMNVLGSDLPQ